MMKHHLIVALIFSFLVSCDLQSQSLFFDRSDQLFKACQRFSISNPGIAKGEAVNWIHGRSLIAALHQNSEIDSIDRFLLAEYRQFDEKAENDPLKRPSKFFGNFYRSPQHFYEKYTDDFYVQIDPLLRLRAMLSNREDEDFVINQRGLRLRAGLGSRVHLETSLLEIQRSFPDYLEGYVNENGAVPGVVFFKNFSSDLMRIERGYDYNIAQAMLKVEAAKFLEVSIGHGKNFIGYGNRSLILSDFAAPYFHLRLNTHLGRFHYQNIFAEIQAESNRDRSGDQLITKKYFVNHYLGYSILDNLEFGVSETVVFSRANQFELQYLNPIIFYRSVEQSLGSEDNVILGFNGKWDIRRRWRIYGQYSFDEFVFNELFVERRGWWGNKWGLQLGTKILEPLGVKNSMLSMEYNLVRPYTYQHRDSITNFSHSKQSLAHPSGSNLSEFMVKWDLDYDENWQLSAQGSWIKQGLDDELGSNFGSNVNQSFNDRVANFGIDQFQGLESNRYTLDLLVSRRLWQTLMVDVNLRYRKEVYPEKANLDIDTWYYGLGLRWNLAHSPLIL